MRILIISPHFWPSNDPRSNRWSALARYWASQGHEVCVLTARYGSRPGREQWAGVHICRKAYKNLESLFFQPGHRQRAAQGRGFRLLYHLNAHLWKKVHWPDASSIWYLPARSEALRLARNFKPDRLISVALPVTAHAVALAVKKRHPGLHWIADWGDPFSLQHLCSPNNRRLFHRLNLRLERSIFKWADDLTFTTEATRRAYRNLYPEAFAKCRVVPPMLSLDVEELAFAKCVSPVVAGDSLRLVYFGTFTPGLREPAPMLLHLQKYMQTGGRSLEVHFYGRMPEPLFAQLKPFPFVSYRGLLARAEVPAVMIRADVLLSVGNRSSLQVPGKSVEYLATAQPVLHFSDLSSDPVCELFEGLPGFCSVAIGKPGEFEKLRCFLDAPPRLAEHEVAMRLRRLERFSLPVVAAAYL